MLSPKKNTLANIRMQFSENNSEKGIQITNVICISSGNQIKIWTVTYLVMMA